MRVQPTKEWVGNKRDLSICCIRSRATGHNVAWSVHVGMVPNPGCIPVCAPQGDLSRKRDRDWHCSVAVLWDMSLWHDNIKGNEGTLGCVFCAALLLPLLQHYLWESINTCTQCVGGTGEGWFSPFFPPFPPLGLLQQLLRILNCLWMLRKACSCCDVCYVSVRFTLFRVMFGGGAEISKKAIQRRVMRGNSHEWHGMYKKTGQFF